MSIGRWIFGAAAIALLAGCHPSPPRHPMGDTNPQAQLARSLAIVRSATPAQPDTLKILFYGQSITSTKWTDPVAAHLRATYPNTHFIVSNLAIGGFPSQTLKRTVERDIGAVYPDLIVFHVYGDHRDYETIVRTIRSKTAAELILQTDHVTVPPEPLCDVGLHFALHAPPGCKGKFWLKQNSWEEFMSGVWMPRMAATYGAAIDPRRWAWMAHMRRHDLAIADLLADTPHPNDRGWALMARLFDTWFDGLVKNGGPHPQTLTEDRPAPSNDTAGFAFTGNRLEAIGRGPLDGRIEATVDGKAARDIDGCWQTSRTNMLPNVPYWPAIRQIGGDPKHRAERWTAIVSDLSPDQQTFSFKVYGSLTGFDGQGSANSDFTSTSGAVHIAAQDWAIPAAYEVGKHARVPEGFKIGWDRYFVCVDEAPTDLGGGRQEVRHVVATGLSNGQHRVTLRIAPGARPVIAAIRSYRPPLAD